jgi:hypothetical protein
MADALILLLILALMLLLVVPLGAVLEWLLDKLWLRL